MQSEGGKVDSSFRNVAVWGDDHIWGICEGGLKCKFNKILQLW